MSAQVTRRAVLAAAWSVPVIALAVSAPAAAASHEPDDHIAMCLSNSGTPSRMFEYLGVSDTVIVAKLRPGARDWFDVNVTMPPGHTFSNRHLNAADFPAGHVFTFPVTARPVWVQCDDLHFPKDCA